MQGNIDERREKKKWAVISVLLISAFVMFFVIAIVMLFAGVEDVFAGGIVLFYIVTGLVVIIGAFVCLKERFKEIDSGEFEEAKKY